MIAEGKGIVYDGEENLNTYFSRLEEQLEAIPKLILRKEIRYIYRREDIFGLFVGCDCIHLIRVVDTLLGSLYLKKDLDYESIYRLEADYYAKSLNISVEETYKVLREVALTFFSMVYKSSGVSAKSIKLSSLIESIEFNEEAKSIDIKFTRSGAELLSGQFEAGTYQKIALTACKTSSVSRYNVMEYIQKHLWKKTFTVSIQDFRAELGLLDKYPRFTDLVRLLLEPSLDDLQKLTDTKVEYSVKRAGRTPISITFTKK